MLNNSKWIFNFLGCYTLDLEDCILEAYFDKEEEKKENYSYKLRTVDRETCEEIANARLSIGNPNSFEKEGDLAKILHHSEKVFSVPGIPKGQYDGFRLLIERLEESE